jgi:hypothetical protein
VSVTIGSMRKLCISLCFLKVVIVVPPIILQLFLTPVEFIDRRSSRENQIRIENHRAVTVNSARITCAFTRLY